MAGSCRDEVDEVTERRAFQRRTPAGNAEHKAKPRCHGDATSRSRDGDRQVAAHFCESESIPLDPEPLAAKRRRGRKKIRRIVFAFSAPFRGQSPK
jgi:hypothetical protein